MAKETDVSTRSTTKLVREGDLIAEVEVNLVEATGGWAPYLSLDDAYKLDDVREALRKGDITRASQLSARIYRLTPVAQGIAVTSNGARQQVDRVDVAFPFVRP